MKIKKSNDPTAISSQPATDSGFPSEDKLLKTAIKGKIMKPAENQSKAGVLFVTSYPPRECGIATYSQDMIKALNDKFSNSFNISICALDSDENGYDYPAEVAYVLKTSIPGAYVDIAKRINSDPALSMVFVQHEFGFFHQQEEAFIQMLKALKKPVCVAFHTVLPNPDENRKTHVTRIATYSQQVVVMTKSSANLLIDKYDVPAGKITEIAHGTHLVAPRTKKSLKIKHDLKYRKVLSTFGLLSSGKGIETTIEALPAIVAKIPEVMFLVLGKTHPEVQKREGEKYRESLEQKVKTFGLENNVRFVNRYLSLSDLLEYLQLTDIYLFTSLDPNQAVSGTFVYAMSCAAPIISTPIPHAKELLTKDTGVIVDFRNSGQLAEQVIRLLGNEPLRKSLSISTLHKTVSTAWENSAVKHAAMFAQMAGKDFHLRYNLPEISMQHLYRMTNEVGIIQFAKLNHPDIKTGYTLDDNARAMVAACMHYQRKGKIKDLELIRKYLDFISMCQQPGGDFLNYVDKELRFTAQNDEVNLDDSNGRAIWALGYLTTLNNVLPADLIEKAGKIIDRSLAHIIGMYSTRAMSFSIKGLYYYYQNKSAPGVKAIIKMLAQRIMLMYRFESVEGWNWFEHYLTYANSIIPEAMLCAWLITDEEEYKKIAFESFDFLLDTIFNEQGIEVISNRGWLKKGETPAKYGEQPIDVAYAIMTLSLFYDVSHEESYRQKMVEAFNWFLGHNRLNHIVYNPVTGGCYDGLEETHVNLNQGAESLASYLMARFTVEAYL